MDNSEPYTPPPARRLYSGPSHPAVTYVQQPWQLNPTYRALRKAGLQRNQPSLTIPSFEKDFA